MGGSCGAPPPPPPGMHVCVCSCVCRGGERNSRRRRKEGRGREEGGDKRKFVTWPPWPAAPPRSHTSQQGVINCLYSHASTTPPPPPPPPPVRRPHPAPVTFTAVSFPAARAVGEQLGATRGRERPLHSITHLPSALPFLSSGRGEEDGEAEEEGEDEEGEGEGHYILPITLPFPVQREGRKRGKCRICSCSHCHPLPSSLLPLSCLTRGEGMGKGRRPRYAHSSHPSLSYLG